jgi:glycosyltransferase involved in cell wall biosynthesis/uridine kinase
MKKIPRKARRIVMVSTHGYWSDPPPAGVPDTGGQTYYVLEVSKTWAQQGRKVIILARWFKPYPVVETFAKNLWLVRIPAGSDEFVRKEDIYPLVPELAEKAVAVSALFGAHAVMGHYADGMTAAVEVGERLGIPTIVIPHSLGINKVISLGYDPYNPESWFNREYNFSTRESFEMAALDGADYEIANTEREPDILKKYYGKEYPHCVMPAGAGNDFFNAFANSNTDLLKTYGVIPHRYFLYFGRFSEAKNVPGVVNVFGEARRMEPELLDGFKLVLVGGSPEKPLPEEVTVENNIREAMKIHRLSENDIVRLPSQPWKTLAVLAHHSMSYIGMQKMEPFGMGVAEAMAAGAPVLISKVAGITRWITDDVEAIVVDPDNPAVAAQRLIKLINDKDQLYKLASNGHMLSKNTFSWKAIGMRQGEIIDFLCQGKSPDKNFESSIKKQKHRAYHRSSFAWRGDPPIIKPRHKKAAEGLLPYIVKETEKAESEKERLVVAIGGESGAGKTEIAEYLRFLLRRHKIWGTTIAGDAFFRLTPAENHKARLKAYEKGYLDNHLGPSEVDLQQLDSILKSGRKKNVREVLVPSECRRLASKRYTHVPVDLTLTDVIFIDLTYSLLLKNATLKVFLESDYQGRIDEVRERNIARDPDQDFQFIMKVLEIEHNIIQKLKPNADMVVTEDYDIKPIVKGDTIE